MQMFTKIFDWIANASKDNSTLQDWLAGLVLILILAFLWSTVIKSMEAV